MWFAINKLSLNVTKTNYMMFENRKLNTCIPIKINEQEIYTVCLVKSKLPKCAIVYSASFLIDRSGMSIVYHSLFLPYTMYCVEPGLD